MTDRYDWWGYVEVDRREGDMQRFQSCRHCGAVVKAGCEELHDAWHDREPATPGAETAAIVRSLAAVDSSDLFTSEHDCCPLCDRDRTTTHKPDCPWRLAAEWTQQNSETA